MNYSEKTDFLHLPPLKGEVPERSEGGGVKEPIKLYMDPYESYYTGYNEDNVNKARKLRSNLTRQERHLWYDFLRSYPVKFYRQRPIGIYVVDFYCSSARLAIELDGGQHYEDKGVIYDRNRSEYLAGFGIDILRYSNLDIDRHFSDVCSDIDTNIKKRLNLLAP